MADNSLEKLRNLIRRHLMEFQRDRDMAVVYQVETHQNSRLAESQIREMAKMYQDLVSEIIELGQQDGSIRKDLYVGLVKRYILGGVDEVINTWLHSESDYDLVSMADPLVELGAQWRDSPRAVAQESDVVFSIVGFPYDVREIYLGDQGVLAGCKPGDVLVDMTTSEPSLAMEIAAIARESVSPLSRPSVPQPRSRSPYPRRAFRPSLAALTAATSSLPISGIEKSRSAVVKPVVVAIETT